MIINLFNNAAKFSPEGSTVEINISQAEINVTIAEIPGSGIGLYIVNSIINELGGNISVESVPNKGTTFTAHLRCAN